MSYLPLIAILGPTASGKTRCAVSLAQAIDAEIVSADSRQVYTGMDIGTGKDMDEYRPLKAHFREQAAAHLSGEYTLDTSVDTCVHLIDICPAGYKYNLYEYLRDYYKAEEIIRGRNHNLILCGGTGMYAEAVLSGMRLPEVPVNEALRAELKGVTLEELKRRLEAMKVLHNTTDVDTHARAVRSIEIELYYKAHPEAARASSKMTAVKPDSIIFLIDIPREQRRNNISMRLDARLNNGMIDEVKALIKSGVNPDDLLYYGLEYKYVTMYILGQLSYNEMRDQLEIAIHQFAKRQMTWWRGMERRGFTLHRLSYDLPEQEFVAAACAIINDHIH